jgi:hypothetical protein
MMAELGQAPATAAAWAVDRSSNKQKEPAPMKRITLLAIVLCGLASACTVHNDRTIVQPTPQPILADPGTTTIVVPAN